MSFTPKIISQRDPLWANEKLGFDDSVTIGTDGCTLVCLTMLVNGYGFTETPSSMNRKLKEMGSGIGFLGGLIVWPGLMRAFPGLVFERIIVCRKEPAPLDEINTSLANGQVLVVEIDESPSYGLQNHWVVLVAQQGNDYLMLDPWPLPADSTPAPLGTRYGFGRPLSQTITAVAFYALTGSPAPTPVPAPAPGTGLYVRVQASVTAGLRLRSTPGASSNAMTTETPGTLLHCLESEALALSKIGVVNQWLQVRDPGGLEGYVAAWYVDRIGASAPAPSPTPLPTPVPSPLPPALTVIISPTIGPVGLRLRDEPDTNSNTLAVLTAGVTLDVLEPPTQALPKIGQLNQWLNVRDASGTQGYIAAWFVELPPGSTPASAPKPAPDPAALTVIVSSQASAGLRLRDQPSSNGNILEVLMPGTAMTVLEPAAAARSKIGVVNQWLNVKLQGGMIGYVAAWYVTT
jgi:SH3-like domain-containing protein